MIPSSAGPLDEKLVTSAITGPHTIVMKLPGHNISILHGKLVRIIGGLILSDSQDDTTMIYMLEFIPLSLPPSHVTHHVTSLGVSQ